LLQGRKHRSPKASHSLTLLGGMITVLTIKQTNYETNRSKQKRNSYVLIK
jgi:hypothetical protein